MSSINDFMASMNRTFPWLSNMGFDVKFFQELAATTTTAEEQLARIRQTPQYMRRFPALRRPDGTLRMNEAQYLAFENDARNLLRSYGYDPTKFESPQSLVGIISSDMDINEFRQRLDVRRSIENGGQAIKDAFYVYAGLDINDDDLTAALIDPAAAQNLQNQYNANVAAQKLDYKTWITRATTLGLRRVASTLEELKRTGALTGAAVQQVLSVSPDFARTMMDALYHGTSDPTQTLGLQDLIESFQFAAVGAAARNAGLTMPDKEQVAKIVAAGVDRARAAQSYLDFAQNQGQYRGAVERATRRTGFSQQDFEAAAFLQQAPEVDALNRGLAAEQAAGQGSGSFQVGQDRQGRFTQGGLRAAGN